MRTERVFDMWRRGEVTLAELRGITPAEMEAARAAAGKLMQAGALREAEEILAGLALYDPFQSATWRLLEDLYRRRGNLESARLFCDIGRAVA